MVRTTHHGLVVLGLLTILFAIAFNIPFSILASTFQYPDILRLPAGQVLDRFAQGGSPLILTWYGFGFAALALIPLSIFLSVNSDRVSKSPALTVCAAMAGALSGTVQAIGLFRWVFAVPVLAVGHSFSDTSEVEKVVAENHLVLVNSWGGVAIGEHMGQWLLALFVLCLSCLQWREGARITAIIGFLAALTIAVGTGEGLALAIGASGEMFSMATVAGFLVLTLWFLATGTGLVWVGLKRSPVTM
jgi:Domain of unknown function (DUF4386)